MKAVVGPRVRDRKVGSPNIMKKTSWEEGDAQGFWHPRTSPEVGMRTMVGGPEA